jgi:hypothetical protein
LHGFSGRLASSDTSAGVPLIFELPVSLPPTGRYEALVGPSWRLGRLAEPASIAAVAAVLEGQVRLEMTTAPSADEVRVVLLQAVRDGVRDGVTLA